MISTRFACAVAVAAASIALLAVPAVAPAQAGGDVKQQSRQVSTASLAEQLGARLSPSQAEELTIGASITGTLADSARLAALGAPGMHAGARVTIMRVGPDRLRVEVDEIDPVPLTKKLTLRMDGQGRLSVIAP
jgi:hypothetical protein